jgi:hypothetical protein
MLNTQYPTVIDEEEIGFDEALEALGPKGIDAVAGMLDVFRRQ